MSKKTMRPENALARRRGDSPPEGGPSKLVLLNRQPTKFANVGDAQRPGGRRSSLHESIVSRLRQMILDGQLSPEERIPEVQFCASFGISRTPLREALKILAAEGLVELRPNRGVVVSRVHADEIADTFEVMGALERLAGHLVCDRISNAEIDELEETHKAMVSLHRRGDRTNYFRLNQDIHRRIIDMAENAVLAATYAGFADKILRARYLANYSQLRWNESVREHEGIMRAIRARDGDKLAQQMEEHSTKTGKVVIDQLRKVQTSQLRRHG